MSVEGPIEPPLRLGDLADVDSPEVVREALARFRRRTMVWVLWIAGAVIAAIILAPTFFPSRNYLPERIRRAPGESIGAVIQQGPVRAVVLQAVRLNKNTFGLHLVVTVNGLRDGTNVFFGPPSPPPIGPKGEPLVKGESQLIQEPARNHAVNEVWIAAPAGTVFLTLSAEADLTQAPGSPRGSSPAGSPSLVEPTFSPPIGPGVSGGTLLTLRIDIASLEIPDWIWR